MGSVCARNWWDEQEKQDVLNSLLVRVAHFAPVSPV